MKHKILLLACFVFVCLVIGMFLAPAGGNASNPLIIGILHSQAYPYATMMKNSFEMALEAL